MTENAPVEKDTQLEQIRRFHASHKIITILSQSKANVENLLETLPDIFAITNIDGYIAKGNMILATLMNEHIEHLLGLSLSSLFLPETWEKFQEYLRSATDHKASVEFELACENLKDNTRRVFNWRVSRFRKNNILKPLYTIIGTDITALRQRELELQVFNQNLQSLVEDKTEDIATLLDSVEQGILSIARDMSFYEAHSKGAEEIFGVKDFSRMTFSELFKLSSKEVEDFSSWFDLITDPRRLGKFKKLALLCPLKERELLIDGEKRYITIDYKPILKPKGFDRLMILCTDITEQKKAEENLLVREKENNLQMERILGLVNNMQISLSIFFDETTNSINRFTMIDQPQNLAKNLEEIFNLAHTLKGNSGSFGFSELAKLTNSLEDILSNIIKKKVTAKDAFDEWQEAVKKLIFEFDNLQKIKRSIFVESTNSMNIAHSEYESLLKELKNNQVKSEDIYRKVVMLNSHPFKDYCNKYNNVIRLYRDREKKNILDLINLTPEKLVHRDIMAIMDVALIHIIRNAIDHGIENDDIRARVGKGPGQITVACSEDEQYFKILVADDGAGIDTEKVVKKAIDLKVITRAEADQMSEEEKVHLIFHSGLTTKDQVTNISGRGAGIGAARAYMEANSGSLNVHSVFGEGSEFTLTIDKNKMLFS